MPARSLVLLAAACAYGCLFGGSPSGGEEPSGLTRVYALSIIEAGPRTDALSRDEAARSDILEAHAAFFEGVVERGDALLLGVFGPRRPRWSMRGLAVLDATTVAEAERLLAEDPAAVAGLFSHAVVPLRGPAGLDTVATRASGSEEPTLRSYCVLTAPDGRAAVRELERPGLSHRVVFIGRLGGARDGELFAILDVPSLGTLEALAVACSADLRGFESAEWLSTPALAAGRVGQAPGASSPPMMEPSK